MELAIAIPSLESLHVVVMNARPTVAGDGVDITGMRPSGAGSFSCVNLAGYLQKNGADVTVTKFGGNAAGVEVWGYKADKTGTKYWWLEGVINGGNDCIVAGAGGFVFPLTLSGIHERLAVVGLSSDVGNIPRFFFEPIEHIVQVIA